MQTPLQATSILLLPPLATGDLKREARALAAGEALARYFPLVSLLFSFLLFSSFLGHNPLLHTREG